MGGISVASPTEDVGFRTTSFHVFIGYLSCLVARSGRPSSEGVRSFCKGCTPQTIAYKTRASLNNRRRFGGCHLPLGHRHQDRRRRDSLHLRLRSGGAQPALFAYDYFRVQRCRHWSPEPIVLGVDAIDYRSTMNSERTQRNRQQLRGRGKIRPLNNRPQGK